MAGLENNKTGSSGSDGVQPLAPSRSRFALRSPNEALQPVAAPAPPPKRRRKSGFLGKISGLLSLLVVLGFVGSAVAFYAASQLNAPGPLVADKVVMIPRNSTGDDIIDQLGRENVVAHPGLLSLYMMVKRPKLRAGEYVFKKESSVADVVETLVYGKPITHKVTIPEGLTSEQIVERLIENDVLSGDIAETPREGTLLPDTYTFERGYSREQMLKSMRAAQEKLVREIWARRSPDVPIRSPLELVTLASIVEKETGKAEERPRVAGVFVNRLNRDMRLQTDPTVIYGIVGGRGSLGRGLTRAELDTPTPFNTYLIKGLPPGPIANPGKAALEAAANPLKTRDLFFVADGKGGHSFAESNEQHSRNVARWRQIEQQQKEAPANAPLTAPEPAPNLTPALPGVPLPGVPLPGLPLPGALPASPPPTRSAIPAPAGSQLAFEVAPARRSVFDKLPMPVTTNAGVSPSSSTVAVPGLDPATLERAVPGVLANSRPNPDSLGFIDDEPVGGSVESYPVPASRRTGGRSIANAPTSGADVQSDINAAALSYQPEPSVAAPARSRAFDAVAGTEKDPLRNKTYDLSFPKTVPNMR